MSTAAAKNLRDTFDERATSGLLREYTEKIGSMISRAESSVKELEVQLGGIRVPRTARERAEQLLDLWKNLRPPAVRLAQYVSATIEHVRIDPLIELELRLRLAEYENNIRFMDSISKALEKLVSPRTAS